MKDPLYVFCTITDGGIIDSLYSCYISVMSFILHQLVKKESTL